MSYSSGKSQQHDIVVVGAGVVGAALSLALARRGFKVALVERGEPSHAYDAAQYDLRVYALAPASVDFLDDLGVWSSIQQQRACAYQAMRVWDDHPAQALSFEAAEIHAPQLGYIVENDLLLNRLWAAMQGVDLYGHAAVASFTASDMGAVLGLSDGVQLRAQLVIAADGAESRLRDMAGIETTGWAYPQKAIVCHVRTEKPHRQTAFQRFLPDGPLAFLPLEDGRCSIVWSTTRADELLALDDENFCEQLTQALQGELGAVLNCTPRLSFPLRLLHAREYVSDRLVLVGDAAHVIHPLAGQGVNLGLADAQRLAAHLADAREHDRDIASPRLLRRYERARKAENLDMLAITDGLYRTFAARNESWDGVRMLGMSAVNQLVPLKNLLARRALGY